MDENHLPRARINTWQTPPSTTAVLLLSVRFCFPHILHDEDPSFQNASAFSGWHWKLLRAQWALERPMCYWFICPLHELWLKQNKKKYFPNFGWKTLCTNKGRMHALWDDVDYRNKQFFSAACGFLISSKIEWITHDRTVATNQCGMASEKDSTGRVWTGEQMMGFETSCLLWQDNQNLDAFPQSALKM